MKHRSRLSSEHLGDVARDHRAPAEIVASVIEKERQVLALLDEIKALVAERVA